LIRELKRFHNQQPFGFTHGHTRGKTAILVLGLQVLDQNLLGLDLGAHFLLLGVDLLQRGLPLLCEVLLFQVLHRVSRKQSLPVHFLLLLRQQRRWLLHLLSAVQSALPAQTRL
jgi:hypothetical protein